jgi:hypothetical protein
MWQMVLGLIVSCILLMIFNRILRDGETTRTSRELCERYAGLLREKYREMVVKGKASSWWEEHKLSRLEARLNRQKEANPEDPDDNSFYELMLDLRRELEVLSWE